MTQISEAAHPTLWQALQRGLAGKCPACGEARLFGTFLKPVASCTVMRPRLDGPARGRFPRLSGRAVLGHLLIPVVVEVNICFDVSTFKMLLWPTVTAIAALSMIQPAKGFVIALIWAR